MGPPVLIVHRCRRTCGTSPKTARWGSLHAGWNPGSSTGSPDEVEAECAVTWPYIVATQQAVDTVKDATGHDVHFVGYSQGGMFCYQAAACSGVRRTSPAWSRSARR